MPDDRTVLDHLLEGRNALVLEVKRLSTAIDELDAVIGQIGGGHRRLGNGSQTSGGTPIVDETPQPESAVDEPVNPPVEVEPARRRTSSRARKSTTRKAAARKSTARQSESPKSIRVHVLEMLGSQDREFGLAEIIERVHDAGIQAHDDAVRSITIKLMKDGRVERVGRGQYRLARRGSAARHAVDGETVTADESTVDEAPSPEDNSEASSPAGDQADEAEQGGSQPDQPQSSSFTPPLNLGQPWN